MGGSLALKRLKSHPAAIDIESLHVNHNVNTFFVSLIIGRLHIMTREEKERLGNVTIYFHHNPATIKDHNNTRLDSKWALQVTVS